jgi:hypothetical protein
MVVERHWRHAQSPSDRPHAHPGQAVPLRNRERRVEDLAAAEGAGGYAGTSSGERGSVWLYGVYIRCIADVLLTDGSGLTSRQVATLLGGAGHVVDVVAPSRLAPTGLTRHVRHVHVVPAFGLDPEGWLDATLAVLEAGSYDALLPTQEQVAILSRDAGRVQALGVGLAAPPFASLLRVQDKIAQFATLAEVGLPHPATAIVRTPDELLAYERLPAYVKAPIGTASKGVRHVTTRADLAAAAELIGAGGAVVQEPVAGPLAMVQAVFAHGRLIAWHVNLRERPGASGGAAGKVSLAEPSIGEHLARLGDALGWHGALSLDAILTAAGPVYIDVNPRLVEPGNAARAGVDLAGILLALSLGEETAPIPPGPPGVRTHQLLLALLGAAERGEGRRGIARELARAAARRPPYSGSAEELTPVRGDPLAVLPVAGVAAATLVAPRAARLFTDGAVAAYALTPEAWAQIVGRARR